MAKRTRYSNRATGRSGSRPARRPSSAPSAPPRPAAQGDEPADAGQALQARGSTGLTEAEVERAAQLEAEANARERQAIADSLRRRSRAAEADLVGGHDVNAPLAVRAAKEYAYVARDVRRIAATAGLMVAILAVLYVVASATGTAGI